jgi:hypothetical protein
VLKMGVDPSRFASTNFTINSFKYVLVRTRYAGIHCGFIESYDPFTRHIVLTQARRIWYWEGSFTITGVALNGFKYGKLSLPFPSEMVLANVEEIMPLSEEIQKFLSEYPAHTPTDKMEED